MDEYAAFNATLDSNTAFAGSRDSVYAPITAVDGSADDDVYSALMSKENDVLDLIRRVDDTKRQDALKSSDQIAPFIRAFSSGYARFLARLVHYLTAGAHAEVVGLVSGSEGMVYTGVTIALIGIVIHLVA